MSLEEIAKKYLREAKVEISPYVTRGTSTLGGILSPHSFSLLIDLLKEAEARGRAAVLPSAGEFEFAKVEHFMDHRDGYSRSKGADWAHTWLRDNSRAKDDV